MDTQRFCLWRRYPLTLRLRLQPKRHRPFIDQSHLHLRAKNAALDGCIQRLHLRTEAGEKRLRFRRWHCRVKAGAVALRRIRRQGELRHQQQSAARLAHIAVHPPFVIGKDAVVQQFLLQARRIRRGVRLFNANQSEQAAINRGNFRAFHPHACAGNPLNQGNHHVLPVKTIAI